jgi:hypothetical protein
MGAGFRDLLKDLKGLREFPAYRDFVAGKDFFTCKLEIALSAPGGRGGSDCGLPKPESRFFDLLCLGRGTPPAV